MFGEYVAGLSYSGDILRTVVLKLKNNGPVLCMLAEEKITDRSNTGFLRSVLEPGTRLVKRARAVSVGVDNGSVFYHSFPVDQSEGVTGRDDQMDWELGNYIGGYQPDDFIKEVRVLSSDARRKTQEVLVVAANKAFVRNIQASIREKKLRLQVIETNFFGASYALAASYPETEMKRVLLATVEGERADAGIFHRGKLEKHFCASLNQAADLTGFLGRIAADGRIDDIYLCGGGATHALTLSARNALGRGVELMNPLRRLRLARSYRKNTDFAGLEYRFASVIGCALRKQ